MNTKLYLEYAMIAVFLLSLGTLGILWWRRALREYYSLAAYLVTMALSQILAIPLLFFRTHLGVDQTLADEIYVYSSWFFFITEYVLLLLILYTVFRLAMQPFEGLHLAGKLIFRWAFGVSTVLAFGFAVGPHIGRGFLAHLGSTIYQVMGILSLCLLLFVVFVARYLGLTYNSRLFGISFGFGLWAITCLIESAVYANEAYPSVYSPLHLWGTLSSCATISVWAYCFLLPEPERKLIVLPTTSPFFFWNRISEALGDDPGHVVVGGFRPEMLAPGELQVLVAASRAAKAKADKEHAEPSQNHSPEPQPTAARHVR